MQNIFSKCIKVCGLARQSDVDLVEQLGFDFAGFIFASQSPRCVTPLEVAALHSQRVKRVGVFTDTPVQRITSIVQTARLDYVQLHGAYSLDDCMHLAPLHIIKVIWPERYASMQACAEELALQSPHVSMFLLDSGTQGGGSGKSLGWSQLRELAPFISSAACKPVLLAGGLGPDNAGEALQELGDLVAGLDINSGVESAPACKDEALLRALVNIVRGG